MNKNFIIIISAVFLVVGAVFLYLQKDVFVDKQTFCTQEAKLCPDGSFVGRTGPNCEFSECPRGNEVGSSGFGNVQMEKAIARYISTQERFILKTKEGSHRFCGIKNLDSERELFPLYIWAYCGEYVLENGSLKTLSGSSGPVKVDYPNELSFYDPSRFTYEAPGDGSRYAEDVRNMFPKELHERIFNFDSKDVSARTESGARSDMMSWELIKSAINNCEAKSVFQAHSREVSAKLKDGRQIAAVEPDIDDIIDIAVAAQLKCGKILMALE